MSSLAGLGPEELPASYWIVKDRPSDRYKYNYFLTCPCLPAEFEGALVSATAPTSGRLASQNRGRAPLLERSLLSSAL